jgi:hypothetical protein
MLNVVILRVNFRLIMLNMAIKPITLSVIMLSVIKSAIIMSVNFRVSVTLWNKNNQLQRNLVFQ